MEKQIKAKVVTDLMRIKSKLLPNFIENRNLVNSNITYCVLETIIAVLMDEYKLDQKDIREALISPESNTK